MTNAMNTFETIDNQCFLISQARPLPVAQSLLSYYLAQIKII